MKEIELTQGKVAIVDDDMFEELSSVKWYARKDRMTGNYYAVRSHHGVKFLYMHRVVLRAPDGAQVDHANRNTLDNRRENLRLCSDSQNRANTPKYLQATSRYKGVCWEARYNKWRAVIYKDRKRRFLGNFQDEIDAARAYDKAAVELFGEFACLNFQ
jgi:hypothetical protein